MFFVASWKLGQTLWSMLFNLKKSWVLAVSTINIRCNLLLTIRARICITHSLLIFADRENCLSENPANSENVTRIPQFIFRMNT